MAAPGAVQDGGSEPQLPAAQRAVTGSARVHQAGPHGAGRVGGHAKPVARTAYLGRMELRAAPGRLTPFLLCHCTGGGQDRRRRLYAASGAAPATIRQIYSLAAHRARLDLPVLRAFWTAVAALG